MGELADAYFRELDVRPAWHRFTGIDWAAIRPERLSDEHRSALEFVTLIEDHAPGYFREYDRLFPVSCEVDGDDFVHNRELYRFTVKWAQEEDAHAHVLFLYQVRAGIATAPALRRRLAEEGKKTFRLDAASPVQVFAYTLVQEKATQLFYQQFARTLAEPVLQGLLRAIARDEARHFAFFARVLTAYVDHHGAAVLADIQDMLRRFKMPLAETIRGYWRWSLRIADAVGGYDHTAAYRELFRVVQAAAGARTWSQTRDLGAWIDAVRGAA